MPAPRALPGTTALRQVLAERGFVGAPHPSVLESRLLRLCHRYRLPRPAVEMVTGRDGEYRLDLAYADIRLAVEVDGYVWHFTPEHQRRDHARRNRLQASGWRMLVYTWRDVVDEPHRVAREIDALYAGLTAARTEDLSRPTPRALEPAGVELLGPQEEQPGDGGGVGVLLRPAPGSRAAGPAPPSG